MTLSMESSVLVFAIEAGPVADLLRIALRNGWSVRRPASALGGYREILRGRPGVAVVQVATVLGDDLELIRLVRTGSVTVSLLAMAVAHRDEIERAVRAAGVEGYFGGAGDAALVERTVQELLEQRKNRNTFVAATRQRGRANSKDSTIFSPPPSPPNRKPGWRGTSPPPVWEGGWSDSIAAASNDSTISFSPPPKSQPGWRGTSPPPVWEGGSSDSIGAAPQRRWHDPGNRNCGNGAGT